MNGTESPKVCVVGAGPAGLATALRMAEHGHAVTLIDAGGPGIDASGPDLHAGPIVGAVDAADRIDSSLVGGTLYPRNHLEATRWRQPGGASWRWWARARPSAEGTVRMVEASPSDLGPRPAFDVPGFPLPATDVLRYRDEALSFLDLDGHSFEPSDYDDGRHPAKLPDSFYDKIFHFPRVAVMREMRPAEAAAHPLIDLRPGLHLRRFERTGQRITGLEFVDGSGSTVTLRPETIVLALGGVENSRQLLAGARDGSIPNPHDLIGRHFMDHPHIRLGYLHEASVEDLCYYDFQRIRDTYVLRGHGIDPEFADREDLLRFSIDLVGRHELDGTATGFALAELQDGLSRRQPKTVATSAGRALRHPISAARLGSFAARGRVHHTGVGGWSDSEARLLPVGVTAVESMFEQRPSWDNRIRLGDTTDRYGVPLPVLQWSFSQVEVDAIHRAVEVTSDAFESAGLGPLTTLRQLGEGDLPRAGTGLHHMGGTRMHRDPTLGVVDENARVHELDNVYIAGSSVFPTSVGFANPTFTVIELALRLGDHLAGHPGPAMETTGTSAP